MLHHPPFQQVVCRKASLDQSAFTAPGQAILYLFDTPEVIKRIIHNRIPPVSTENINNGLITVSITLLRHDCQNNKQEIGGMRSFLEIKLRDYVESDHDDKLKHIQFLWG